MVLHRKVGGHARKASCPFKKIHSRARKRKGEGPRMVGRADRPTSNCGLRMDTKDHKE